MRKLIVLAGICSLLSTMAFAGVWQADYTADGDMDGMPYRARGIAVTGENSFVGTYGRDGYTTYALFIYNNADLSNSDSVYSVSYGASSWVNPDAPTTDTNSAQWGWGTTINPLDGNVYAVFGGSQCPILSWDMTGNSVNKAASTRSPDTSIYYVTALDTDNAGEFVTVRYGGAFDGWTSPTVATSADVVVFPPTTDPAWLGTKVGDPAHAMGHNPTPIASIDCDGDWDINEGVCITPDGNHIYITNRGGPTLAYKYDKDAGNPFGYTLDAGFTFVKGAGNDGLIRGCDVSADATELYTCWDDGAVPSVSYVSINDAATGAFISTVNVAALGAGLSGTLYAHDSAYDVEVVSAPYGSPSAGGEVAKSMWISHYYGWYVDKLSYVVPPAAVNDWTLF